MDSTLRTLLAEQTWKARYHLHEVMCLFETAGIRCSVEELQRKNCRGEAPSSKVRNNYFNNISFRGTKFVELEDLNSIQFLHLNV